MAASPAGCPAYKPFAEQKLAAGAIHSPRGSKMKRGPQKAEALWGGH